MKRLIAGKEKGKTKKAKPDERERKSPEGFYKMTRPAGQPGRDAFRMRYVLKYSFLILSQI